jgi:glycosyltransferase involved in cell wall biosynthesis
MVNLENNVLISVIIPVYNVEKYLERCLDSLIESSSDSLEYILINDGSIDSSGDICERYSRLDKRITVIHQENKGLGLARNTGIEISKGKYIAFVDSDDFISLNMHEILYRHLKELSVDTIFSGFIFHKKNQENDRISETRETKIFATRIQIENFLLDMIGSDNKSNKDRLYQMSVWRGLYSAELIKSNNILFHSEKEFISEDVIFHIDYLTHAKKIAIIPDSLYYYCENGDSFSLSRAYRTDRFQKYLMLYLGIQQKLPILGIKERSQRLLVGYTRSLIFALPTYDLSLKDKINEISKITKNDIWKEIEIFTTPNRMPLYQHVIHYLISYKCIYILLIISECINYTKLLKNSFNSKN